MTRLLHIVASPRRQDSKSNEIARAHIEALRDRNPALTVDVLDLWHESLPEFDGDSAAAKMSFFGIGKLDGVKRTKWDEIVAITRRFQSSDHYVFGVPM
jgi:FMN-dependent NADH-azoreductase